jgi:hypothetical protein
VRIPPDELSQTRLRRSSFVAAAPGLDTGEQDGQLAVSALIELSSRERERSRVGFEAERGGEIG